MSKRVAIIGAGPSGAIALSTFVNAGFTDITVFERRSIVGGTWNLDEHLGKPPAEDVPGILRTNEEMDPPVPVPVGALSASEDAPVVLPLKDYGPRYDEGSLYPQVETNVTADFMAFSSKPFPPIYPAKSMERFGCDDAYRTHSVVRDYVLEYFENKSQYLRLGVTVERAFQPGGPGSQWKLVLRKTVGDSKEQWYSESFDFVYAATGRFNVPRLPETIPGLKDAVTKTPRGTVLHTKTFRDPTLFKGKRVVLLGASWSNSDVAHLSYAAGALVPIHLSFRSVMRTAIPSFAQPWIEAHPLIKDISVQEHNKKLRLEFQDGSELDDVDHLMLGTGYRISFPYLADYLDKWGGIYDAQGTQSRNLYWTTWWKYDPSLAVTSIISDGITWRVLETQALATASLWQRPRQEWPTVAEADKWESTRLGQKHVNFHQWYPHYTEFFTGLAKAGGFDIGKLPDFVGLFERSLSLKNNYWTRCSLEALQEHPEWRSRYQRTLAALEAVQVERGKRYP